MDYFQDFFSSTIKKAKFLYASSSRYNEKWHSDPHAHYCSELFYVTEGKGHIQIDNDIHPISTHDLIIINPNVKHTELSDPNHPLAYIVIGIEDIELSLLSDDDLHFTIINLKDIRNTTFFYFNQILEESHNNSPGSDIICHNLIENLLILLSRHVKFTESLSPKFKKNTLLCISVRQYIDKHYQENITLDLLADVFHVSKYHMVHVFTAEYNISPINYLILKRIEEGKKLLKTTDHSLTLISRTLGFSSLSYFSQVFKKHLHCTPLEYRKNSQKNDAI